MLRALQVLSGIIGTVLLIDTGRCEQNISPDEGNVVDQLVSALGNRHGVDMAAVRKIGDGERVRAILLNIVDPETGDFWAPGELKREWLRRAILALGELGERRAIPRLNEILKTSSGVTKMAAIEALGKIDADAAKDLLYPLLLAADSRDFGMQWILVSALARCKDRQMNANLDQYIRGEPDPKSQRILLETVRERRKALPEQR